MRKDELVHLHSLLTVLRAEYERRGAATEDVFAAYEELDVSPMAVYGSKDDHRRAVKALASALADLPATDDGADVESSRAERSATAQS